MGKCFSNKCNLFSQTEISHRGERPLFLS
ncbi:unnamed protein product [Staurois parvus]|uniref:Uncharacterized protein n=1 Tax=Staurois parvus TaxID=386267 RepID=A0ABN9C1R3_9NEOB|nr:unnamed protein product [Staurois parvus]